MSKIFGFGYKMACTARTVCTAPEMRGLGSTYKRICYVLLCTSVAARPCGAGE